MTAMFANMIKYISSTVAEEFEPLTLSQILKLNKIEPNSIVSYDINPD